MSERARVEDVINLNGWKVSHMDAAQAAELRARGPMLKVVTVANPVVAQSAYDAFIEKFNCRPMLRELEALEHGGEKVIAINDREAAEVYYQLSVKRKGRVPTLSEWFEFEYIRPTLAERLETHRLPLRHRILLWLFRLKESDLTSDG